ncbi:MULTISPECIES: FG-GAP repeat domain-containing protein [Flavobacteriaceae]|uniref:FG-GAP repeat domain-containing protein n=1 Tax=Flavobacteriaceae TaxID=49546 RepID=UPI00234BD15F|nr:VCBS repeat-containing protein [Muricauda sp. SP22]MDC6363757.1 VCBS repeat-containing protein [Muricauda sp. SP22]
MKKLTIVLLLSSAFVSNAQNLTFKNVTETNLPEISHSAKKNSMDAKVGDIDTDGDLDIVVAVEFFKNIILINDGKGNFMDGRERLPDLKADKDPKPYPYYPYHDTEDVALEDFDKDGDLDIIFVTEDDKVNEYYLNDGRGYFIDNTDKFPTEGVSNSVLAGDFDSDGWLEIIVGNNGQNIYLDNNEEGFMDKTEKYLPMVEDITQDMQSIDFDNDGDLDVIVANEKENRFLLNDGKGAFKDVTSVYFEDGVLADETREATFADVDNDGDFDIYFANVYMFQQLEPIQRLLINPGNGDKFSDETEKRLGFTKELSILDGTFADLDKDGDQDLLLLTHKGPKLFQNDGKGYFTDITEKSIGMLQADGVDTEIADFNGDGLMDIFISCFRGSDVLLFQE